MVHSANGRCWLTDEGWALVPEACPELLHVIFESSLDYALDGAADDLDALNDARQWRRRAAEWSEAHPIHTKMYSRFNWGRQTAIVAGDAYVWRDGAGGVRIVVEMDYGSGVEVAFVENWTDSLEQTSSDRRADGPLV